MKNEEIGVDPHGRLLGVYGSPESLIFHWFYKVLRHGGITMRKPSLGNAFSMILEAKIGFGTIFLSFDTRFHKVF